MPLHTSEGAEFVPGVLYSRQEFASIRTTDPAYALHVAPVRQAYAAVATHQNPRALVFFLGVLFLLFVAMASFRSPAVALMPDVTSPALRSRGNAIINLLGSAGGIFVLLLGSAMGTGDAANAMIPYAPFFALVALGMLAALALFLATVRENRFVAGLHAQQGAPSQKKAGPSGPGGLSPAQRRSAYFLLGAIVLWFMAYNAVTSKYSVYAGNVLHLDYNLTLLLAQASAICSYLPSGALATRFGRRKMVLSGAALLTLCFLLASFLRESSHPALMNLMFVLAGVDWATINVHSFPMVVELAREADIGRFTGYYYTASMAAQIVTPMFSGALMDLLGMTALFPYAAVFAALSFVAMLFVRHGDTRPEMRRGLEAPDGD